MDPYDFEIPDVIPPEEDFTLSHGNDKRYQNSSIQSKVDKSESKKPDGASTTLRKESVTRSAFNFLEKANDYLTKASGYARSSRTMKYDLSLEEDELDAVLNESGKNAPKGIDYKDAIKGTEAFTLKTSIQDETIYNVVADESSSEAETGSNNDKVDGIVEGRLSNAPKVQMDSSDEISARYVATEKYESDHASELEEMSQDSIHTQEESEGSTQEKSDHSEDNRYDHEDFESNLGLESSQSDHTIERVEDHVTGTEEKSDQRSNASFDYSMDFSQVDATELETPNTDANPSLSESQQSNSMHPSSISEDKSTHETVSPSKVYTGAFHDENTHPSLDTRPSSNLVPKGEVEAMRPDGHDAGQASSFVDQESEISSNAVACGEVAPLSSKKPSTRVKIVREYILGTKTIEKKDASTQFTGNHAIIQTNLTAPGMFTVCSDSYQPKPRASATDQKDDSRCQHNIAVDDEEPGPQNASRRSTDASRNAGRSNVYAEKFQSNWDETDYSRKTGSFYKQQLWLIQAQIEEKRAEMQRYMSDRQQYHYTSLENAENHTLLHRPAPLQLWEALMRVDSTISTAKAKRLARLASTS
uniref:AlNc14C79G5207 protein n=1 Tax=Albugo laibachii Nc14 TaxID=890382 RepID=F0WF13_9STRA|nr:AlNc14C79G5207 [Albugo laibachii Nc14]CCA24393.1 dentin sialophosphoprotein precursor putative [Albugo laibachii Nc14]|eukprot:CCA24393.1 dentin sialophosphoprotein precursor putative [Albugo laibachii Nc14]